MLAKICIQGLFDEYDYEIVLDKGNLTYLHSQNGLGKSTVMKMIHNLLEGNLEEVRTTVFDRLDLVFDDGKILTVENKNQELSILGRRNEVDEKVGIRELKELLKSVYIGPERTFVTLDNGETVSAVDLYMKDITESIEKARSDSRIVPGDCGEKMSDADLDKLFKDTEARIAFIKQAGFGPEIPSGLRFPPSRYEISCSNTKYLALARALDAYVGKYYRLAESIVVFKDIVNTMFVNKTVDFNGRGYLEAHMDRSGITIPLSKFSSGEKQIMVMFYQLLFKAAPGSLVIIDEPEVSLHVNWQHQLGKFFMDIARIRELQVLVTTHAPAVIHDDWDKAVELENSRCS
ncbi:MAG: ATP-binding protein [archaeon]|nr:ATP-binding protein [archaeon]